MTHTQEQGSRTQLTVRGVSKSYGDTVVLRDVTARVFPGETTAFIGPNGAGKTTLFHVFTGVAPPDQGSVLLNGSEIAGLASWRIARKGIGWLFQDVRVFGNLTATENVLLALLRPSTRSAASCFRRVPWRPLASDEQHERVVEWLAFVGLADCADRRSGQLSYGQQKLLALARVLATGCPVILLDEPTSGLAPRMVETMIALLRELKQRRFTIALIEHDMHIVEEIADWVTFMHAGEIAAIGRVDHVLGDPAVRNLYLGV